jgi:hypothetical protein
MRAGVKGVDNTIQKRYLIMDKKKLYITWAAAMALP